MRSLLDTEVDVKTALLSRDQKASVIASASTELQNTARLLEAMKTLSPMMDRLPIQNLAGVRARLSAIEGATMTRSTEVSRLHGDVDSFVDAYNSLMDVVSRKFVLLDATITSWENALSQALSR